MKATTIKPVTKFELAQEQVKNGTLTAPEVSYGAKRIDYFAYQLATHKFQLGILKSGMSMRGVKLRDLKGYYGLTGKSASDCYNQFIVIFDNYTNKNK